jgi:Tol biopolymer transport system component
MVAARVGDVWFAAKITDSLSGVQHAENDRRTSGASTSKLLQKRTVAMNMNINTTFRVLVLTAVFLASCVQPSIIPPEQTVSSPVNTPTIMPTATVLPPLLTPSPTATSVVASVPTSSSSAFSPESIAAMSAWKEADNVSKYRLIQISETPLGVDSLDWSPDSENLWLNVATELGGMGNIARTTSLVTNRNTHKGWAAGQLGDYLYCSVAHDWSPDGSQLAYIDHNGQLWLADTEGRNPHSVRFPTNTAGISLPSYSPDGNTIAVLGYHIVSDTAQYDIWVIDAATQTPNLIIPNAGYGKFIWSPSGDALAHLGGANSSEAYPIGAARLWIAEFKENKTVSTDLGSLPGTEGCLKAPNWIADGEKVLTTVLLTPGIWVIDREGNVERLDKSPQSQRTFRSHGLAAPLFGGSCDGAIVSPSGRYVVYTTGTGLPKMMYVMDIQNKTKVTLGMGDLCYGTTRITWSPEGPRFLRWGENLPLELVSATDGNTQQLASIGLWPAWSPDGRDLVYWRPEVDGYTLWLLHLDNMESARLTSPSRDDPQGRQQPMPFAYDIEPRWSPDSRSIAFVSYRTERPEAYLLQLR